MASAVHDLADLGGTASLVHRVCASGSECSEHVLGLTDSPTVARTITSLRQAGVLPTPPAAASALSALLVAASAPNVPKDVAITRLTEPWIQALPSENPLLPRSTDLSGAGPAAHATGSVDWSFVRSSCAKVQPYPISGPSSEGAAAAAAPAAAAASARAAHRVRELVDRALTGLLPSDAASELAGLLAAAPSLLLQAGSQLTPATLPKLVDTNPGVAVAALRAVAAVAPPSLLTP